MEAERGLRGFTPEDDRTFFTSDFEPGGAEDSFRWDKTASYQADAVAAECI